MSETILKINNLVKTYPNGVQALKGVTFDVKRGEFLVIIGLSGSGKSTLLRCINRLHDPTSGEVLFTSSESPSQPMDVSKIQGPSIRFLRKKVAMIFQHFNLIPRHSVISNVLMGRLGQMGILKSLLGQFSKAERDLADKYLKLVGIGEKAKIRADQLSGGQQQRVAIARALIHKPSLIICDEPTAALDSESGIKIMDLIKEHVKMPGRIVIIVTHDSRIFKYADRIETMNDGKLL